MPHCPGWAFRMILILNHPQIGDRKVKRAKIKNLTAKKSDLERLESKRRWSLKPLVAIQQVLCFDAYIFWDESKDLTETLNKGCKVGFHPYQMYFKTNYRKARYKYHKLVIKKLANTSNMTKYASNNQPRSRGLLCSSSETSWYGQNLQIEDANRRKRNQSVTGYRKEQYFRQNKMLPTRDWKVETLKHPNCDSRPHEAKSVIRKWQASTETVIFLTLGIHSRGICLPL